VSLGEHPESLTGTMSPDVVLSAQARIAPHVHRTPLMSCQLLNDWLGHELVFKVECFQRAGAFKIRGALNAMLQLKEEGRLPKHIVAFSSGNHAQAVALAGTMLGVKTTVIMPKFVSKLKQQATRSYGAELILTDTRMEAEELAAEKQAQGAWLLHPSADDMVIAGQGTACLEALQDAQQPDAVFATCGGGGLLSGTWLATKLLTPDVQVFGAEPVMANDATQSYRSGKIFSFTESPMTIADGARTLHVSELTMQYLRRLAGFYEVEERDIIYWTQWLTHLLKVNVEPTAAVAMGAAYQWLRTQTEKKRALVILSGGNIGTATYQQIWKENYLDHIPAL